MTKGRRLITSRSERFLGYNYVNGQSSTFHDSSELREDDVWSTVDDREDNHTEDGSASDWSSRASFDTKVSYSGRNRQRVVPQNDRKVGGLSLALDDDDGITTTATQPRIVDRFRGRDSVASSRGRHIATSAPVNVPDWSKILRVESIGSLHDFDDGSDEFESEVVPPHEYLARSRKTSAMSVFEGVGRTLKGRDLSRVRDAVWSQTGYYG